MSTSKDTNMISQTTMNMTSHKEIVIMKPLPFNGDRTKVKAFIQECNIYLTINKDTYSTDQVKVAFILSLMNKKEALLWKGHFINQITGKDMKITFPTFAEFLKKLELSENTMWVPSYAYRLHHNPHLVWYMNSYVHKHSLVLCPCVSPG